jgi:hypothetical protein
MDDQLAQLLRVHQPAIQGPTARAYELPDPAGLLQGSGKVHRHVKLRRPEELDQPALRDLIAAAAAASAARPG